MSLGKWKSFGCLQFFKARWVTHIQRTQSIERVLNIWNMDLTINYTLFAWRFVIYGLLSFFLALPTPHTLASAKGTVDNMYPPSPLHIFHSRTRSRYLQCHTGPKSIKQWNNDQCSFISRQHKKKNCIFLKNKFPKPNCTARKHMRKRGHFEDECVRKESQRECETGCFVV